MAERKLNIMVIDTIKPNRDEKVKEIMMTKLKPAMQKQRPDFKWKVYRPVVGKLGLMMLFAQVTPEQLVNYDEWVLEALEKEHGKEEVARYLKEWFDCMGSSEYMAVVEDPEWSNQ